MYIVVFSEGASGYDAPRTTQKFLEEDLKVGKKTAKVV